MLYYTLKRLGDTKKFVLWKSNALSAKKLTTPTTNDNSLSPSVKLYRNSIFCLVFKGSCLKQKKNTTYNTPNRMIFLLFMN